MNTNKENNWKKKNSNHYVPLLENAGVKFKQKGVYETDEWYFYPSKAFAMNKKDTNIRKKIEDVLGDYVETPIRNFTDIISRISKVLKLTPHKTEKDYYTFEFLKEEHYIMKYNNKIILSFFGIYQNKSPQIIYNLLMAIRACKK